MAQRPRAITETDKAAWADYIRHVKSLSGREHPEPPASPAAPTAPAAQPGRRAPAPATLRREAALPSAEALVTGLAPAGLDRASWNRLRGGKLVPARTLDLHGKTAQAAFHALERFLQTAHVEQLRCVEVITGRGSGEQGGVIRRELPMWLNLSHLRPLVLAAAHPHTQNAGSTLLLLRRIRN